jgi:hypothetical protein
MCLARLSSAGQSAFAAPQDSDNNVNARYTVETVILSGKGLDHQPAVGNHRQDQHQACSIS